MTGPWCSGIALNLCRGVFRRKDLGWLLPEEAPEPAVSPRPDERVDLERALARLPDGYRTVLVLHDVEGFRHDEIASALGTTAGTSKSQLHRARRAVRAMLEPVAETGEEQEHA